MEDQPILANLGRNFIDTAICPATNCRRAQSFLLSVIPMNLTIFIFHLHNIPTSSFKYIFRMPQQVVCHLQFGYLDLFLVASTKCFWLAAPPRGSTTDGTGLNCPQAMVDSWRKVTRQALSQNGGFVHHYFIGISRLECGSQL